MKYAIESHTKNPKCRVPILRGFVSETLSKPLDVPLLVFDLLPEAARDLRKAPRQPLLVRVHCGEQLEERVIVNGQ